MKAEGFLTFATDLDNPSFAAIATAAGLHGVRVERPSELEPALREAFAHDGPSVVEAMVARQELSVPPDITLHQAAGFAMYATRTILSGGGDEILDVARTNLRQVALE